MEQTFYIKQMIDNALVNGQYSSLGYAHTICSPIIKHLDASSDNTVILDYENIWPNSPFVIDSITSIVNFDNDKLKRIKVINLDLEKWQTAVNNLIGNNALYLLALRKLNNPYVQQIFEHN